MSAVDDIQRIRYFIGLGCRRAAPVREVVWLVEYCMDRCELSRPSIDGLATIVDKAGEPGLIGAARYFDLPLDSWSADTLARFEPDLSHVSTVVRRRFGVAGVAEPAAIASTVNGRLGNRGFELCLPKQSRRGVTAAVARGKAIGAADRG